MHIKCSKVYDFVLKQSYFDSNIQQLEKVLYYIVSPPCEPAKAFVCTRCIILLTLYESGVLVKGGMIFCNPNTRAQTH